MPLVNDSRVLVGTQSSDDAAVYELNPETAIAATVDFFTPVVDDPYDFGLIAAANALSDIYAMGAKPLFALNIAGFPRDRLPIDLLGRILEGGSAKAAEAGIFVIGGHTVDDAEPKYGLAVVGQVAPDRVVRNVGARIGDRLFLTKPLGSGMITTAIKRGRASEELIRRIIRVMATLNRGASEAMVSIGPDAATDVTGFGLLGHLWEMLSGSGVGAMVNVDKVPVIPEVWQFAHEGVVPGGTHRNLAALEERVVWGAGVDEVDQLVLADAQTSGGLLIAVRPERAEALRVALEDHQTLASAEIGTVVEGDRLVVEHRG